MIALMVMRLGLAEGWGESESFGIILSILGRGGMTLV